jgi:restriction system protein
METKMTIVECIRKVLASENRSLTISQIYEMIYQQGLYSFNSKDPRTIVRQQIRRHCVGLTFPSAMPNKYFRMTEKGKYCLVTESNSSAIQNSLPAGNERISEEHIQDFHLQHIEEVRQNLIETLLNTDPAFFEQLILDLLLKMGYGLNGSASRRGNGPDGGIDGEILQDRLGFDRIYTQAKRYALDRPVRESEIRDFVGALKSISKGVFITTSKFTTSALNFASDQQQKILVLIDGQRLAQLMLEFELGVQKTHSYATFRIDSDYFGESP